MGIGYEDFEEIAEKRRARREKKNFAIEQPVQKNFVDVTLFGTDKGEEIHCRIRTTEKNESTLIEVAKKNMGVKYCSHAEIVTIDPESPQP